MLTPFDLLMGFLGAIIGILIVFLIIKILFLLTLQKTFDAISRENRKMDSGQVWLLLIPFFALAWNFIVIDKLADSLKLECEARNIPIEEGRPGYTIGLAYSILACSFIIPYLNFISWMGSLVCGIIFWVKINNYKKALAQAPRTNPNMAKG